MLMGFTSGVAVVLYVGVGWLLTVVAALLCLPLIKPTSMQHAVGDA
jgi:hypothetical protein